MNPEPPSSTESLSIPLSSVVNVALEHWRIAKWLGGFRGAANSPVTAPARHALRKIDDFLRACELEVRLMDGHVFDAGLAVRVIDATEDPTLPPDRVEIAETLSPMVLWRGQVIRSAEVITRRGAPAGAVSAVQPNPSVEEPKG